MIGQHLVIAIADGDGSIDYGKRIWSERFLGSETAHRVAIWLQEKGITVLVEQDVPSH